MMDLHQMVIELLLEIFVPNAMRAAWLVKTTEIKMTTKDVGSATLNTGFLIL